MAQDISDVPSVKGSGMTTQMVVDAWKANKEESKPTSFLLNLFMGSLVVAVTVLVISVISFQSCTLSFGGYTGMCSATQAATPGCDCTKIIYDPLYVNAMIISGGYIGMWILIGIGIHFWSKFRT